MFQSHQEEDLSDPDLQDEESGEELPQQPLQGSNHTSENNSVPVSTPTPITHLNNLMNSHHPHFLAKLKMEVSYFEHYCFLSIQVLKVVSNLQLFFSKINLNIQ